MERNHSKKTILTRYSIKRALGEFSFWNCYIVKDSLSEKEYLLFSFPISEETAIDLEDLKSRSYLFKRTTSTNTWHTINIIKSDGEIAALVPYNEFAPITKTLPLEKKGKVKDQLSKIIRVLLEHTSTGLFFSALNSESIVKSGNKLIFLPTTYLLPTELHLALKNETIEFDIDKFQLITQIKYTGKILELFSKHLEEELSYKLKKLAKEINELDYESKLSKVIEIINDLSDIAEIQNLNRPVIPLSVFSYSYIHTSDIIKMLKEKIERLSADTKHLIIIEGKCGDGRTSLLRNLHRNLERKWNFGKGLILNETLVFSTHRIKELSNDYSFFIIDDHFFTQTLSFYIVDAIFKSLDEFNFGLVAIDSELDRELLKSIEEEATRGGIKVTRFKVKPPGKAKKEEFIQTILQILPKKQKYNYNVEDMTPEEIRISFIPEYSELPKRKKPLDTLVQNERSLLNFLSVFMFEAPLSFLKEIYSTENDGLYDTIQNLVRKGLVKRRAARTSLSQERIAIHYSIASRTISWNVCKNIPKRRIEELHRNIANLLAQRKNIPLAYLFYHLLEGGERREAARIAVRIARSLIKEKREKAIRLFNSIFTSRKLEKEVSPEERFKLLLEIGNYFSLIGEMDIAESYFSMCREQISKDENRDQYRELIIEACRNECEILEKKGDFLKAEKLLKQTLDEEGPHLSFSFRAKLYNDLAWVQYRLGRFNDSWEFCLLVHKLLDEKSEPDEVGKAYNLMGVLNWNRSKYEDAILCHKKALSLRESTKDEIGIAVSYNNLALVYRSMGRATEALEYLQKSLEIKKKYSNVPGLAAAHLNIALAYLDLERFDEAESNCLTAKALSEEIGNLQLLAECYGTMGEIYFAKGEYARARKFYFEDLHICHKTKSLREHAIVFRRLGELSLVEGKITEAESLLNQARDLNKIIGSRLEAILLNMLEGKILFSKNSIEEAKRKLEACALELSMLGKKNSAAIVSAELGNIYLDENNETLAREYLNRALSLIENNEPIPHEVRRLKKRLDELAQLSPKDISTDSGRFKAICKIISLLPPTRNKEAFYRAVVEILKKITGMGRILLAIEADRKGSLRHLTASGFKNQKPLITDKNITRVIKFTKKLGYPFVATTEELTSIELDENFLREHPIIACYPLKMHGEIKAYLYMDSSQGKNQFNDEESSFLATFSHLLSQGLERILLNEELESLRKQSQILVSSTGKTKEEGKYSELIGSSSAMKHIYELIDGIKNMDTTILLTGENGTGKDLIARTIHYSSHRASKPFVSLNCSAIPGELLESELFGHEKGAFTGAYRQRIGHFESANGGTILLNEIGDLPLQLQPKLLRLLEEQKFYRLGGTKEISTNVRIIAATNKDLLSLVNQGRFREDLYYRINIFPIRVPPLRERKEDIEPLCEHFLTMYCRLYNVPKKVLSHETLAYLIDYDWPGNVRELENLINRLIIISKGNTILPEDLPDYIVKKHETIATASETSLEEAVDEILGKIKLSEAEPILPKIQGMIIKKMVEKTGDKTKAAAMLGISKPTLYAKLKEYEKK